MIKKVAAALMALPAVSFAGTLMYPGEAGHQVVYPSPLVQECLLKVTDGANLMPGANDCVLEYPLAIEAGKTIQTLRVYYRDTDLMPSFEASVMSRSLIAGGTQTLGTAMANLPMKQADSVLVVPMSATVAAGHAPFVRLWLNDNALIKGISVEYAP